MRQRYALIDVLRGFAALLVVFYHVIELDQWKGFPITGLALLPRIGWVGVDLFFVISGFVIGKTAIESFTTQSNWRRIYAERRIRRIVPLYLLTMACCLVVVSPHLLHLSRQFVVHLGSHLLFLHNLSPATHGSIDGPNWSVALEMQFYLLILLLTPWLARAAWWKVLLTLTSVAICWRYGTTLFLIPGTSSPYYQNVYATQLPGVLDRFAFGICLAKLALSGSLHFSWTRQVAWAVAAIGLLMLAWHVFWRNNYWNNTAMIVLWHTLLSAGFAALVALFVLMPVSGGWATVPFRYLGEISYGIYLWHLPVVITLQAKTSFHDWKLLSATMIGTIVLADLSWHGCEKRWLKLHQTPVGREKEAEKQGEAQVERQAA